MMIHQHILKLSAVIALLIFSSLLLFGRSPVLAHPPMDATPLSTDLLDSKYLNKNSCPDDPKNLALNGGFFPDLHDTQYGPVVNPWQPFIYGGSAPSFRWVNNEGIFKGQSEQLYSSNAFDAGIMQTVQNLQPNSYYWFRLGWAPAAKSANDGPNNPTSSVGVKVGVDPFGGSDPLSANVIWGAGLFGDNKGLNRPQLTMVFAARSSNSTIFLRGIATDGSGGENRVWFNAVCMEARPELGTAPPLTPTATPTVPPTATRPPATRPPATRAVPTRTSAPIQVAIGAPDTPVPTAQTFIEAAPATAEPRFARPEPTPASSPPIDLGQGAMASTGALMLVGGGIFFSLGILIWKRAD